MPLQERHLRHLHRPPAVTRDRNNNSLLNGGRAPSRLAIVPRRQPRLGDLAFGNVINANGAASLLERAGWCPSTYGLPASNLSRNHVVQSRAGVSPALIRGLQRRIRRPEPDSPSCDDFAGEETSVG